jgi:hypothetical protein
MAWGREVPLGLLFAALLLLVAEARPLRHGHAGAPVDPVLLGIDASARVPARALKGSDSVTGAAADSWGVRDLPRPREVRASSGRVEVSPSPSPPVYGYQSTAQAGGRMNQPIVDSGAWGRSGGGSGGGGGGPSSMGGRGGGGGGGGYYGGYGR